MPSEKKCLKCGHARDLDDGENPLVCPSCGAVYAKVEAAARAGEDIFRTGRFTATGGQVAGGPKREATAQGQKPSAGKVASPAVQLAEIKSTVSKIEAILQRHDVQPDKKLGIPPAWIVAAGAILVLFAVSLPMASAGKVLSGSVLMQEPIAGLIALAVVLIAWIWAAHFHDGRIAIGAGALLAVSCAVALHRIHKAIREMQNEAESAGNEGLAGGFSSLLQTIASPTLDIAWPMMVLAAVLLLVGGIHTQRQR